MLRIESASSDEKSIVQKMGLARCRGCASSGQKGVLW